MTTFCRAVRELPDSGLELIRTDVTLRVFVERLALRLELLAKKLRLVAQEVLVDCELLAMGDCDANDLPAEFVKGLVLNAYLGTETILDGSLRPKTDALLLFRPVLLLRHLR
jgi:hypothetical protein